MGQREIYMLLANNRSRKYNARELSAYFGISPASVSRAVARLNKDNFIKSEQQFIPDRNTRISYYYKE